MCACVQLAFSDRILLNKIDLVDAPYLSQVEERIRTINKFAPIVKTTLNVASNLESTITGILGIRAFSLDKVLTHTWVDHRFTVISSVSPRSSIWTVSF